LNILPGYVGSSAVSIVVVDCHPAFSANAAEFQHVFGLFQPILGKDGRIFGINFWNRKRQVNRHKIQPQKASNRAIAAL